MCVFISEPAPSPPLERQVLNLTDKFVSDIPITCHRFLYFLKTFFLGFVILKSRRISKSLEQILLSIDKFAKPGSNIKDYSVYDDVDLWGDVCKDLEVPNTFANRVKIRKATAHLWKVFFLL